MISGEDIYCAEIYFREIVTIESMKLNQKWKRESWKLLQYSKQTENLFFFSCSFRVEIVDLLHEYDAIWTSNRLRRLSSLMKRWSAFTHVTPLTVTLFCFSIRRYISFHGIYSHGVILNSSLVSIISTINISWW